MFCNLECLIIFFFFLCVENLSHYLIIISPTSEYKGPFIVLLNVPTPPLDRLLTCTFYVKLLQVNSVEQGCVFIWLFISACMFGVERITLCMLVVTNLGGKWCETTQKVYIYCVLLDEYNGKPTEEL